MGVIPSFDMAQATRVLKETGGDVAALLRQTEALRRGYAQRHLDLYDQAYAAVKAGEISFDESGMEELARSVLRVRRVLQITPDFSPEVLDQVLRIEKVHKARDRKDLLLNRLGYEGDDTDCQAITVPTNQGLRVLCQIFRYHTQAKVNEDGLIYPDTLPGNLDLIKTTPIQKRTGDENVTGYWTISSKMPNYGEVLIGDLKRRAQRRFETTISPGHELRDQCDADSLMNFYETYGLPYVQNLALQYLEAAMNNPNPKVGSVAKFHLGEGAFLTWLHFNPQSVTDKFVFNFGYDRKIANTNKAIFQSGQGDIPVSEALHARLGRGQPVQSKRLSARALAA